MATRLSSDDFLPFCQNVQPSPVRVYSLESSGPARVYSLQSPAARATGREEDTDRGEDTEHWPVLLIYGIKQQVCLTGQNYRKET